MSKMLKETARVMGRTAVGCAKMASVVFDAVGVYSLFRFFKRNQTIILMYHGITETASVPDNFDGRQVDATLFEHQIEYLKKNYDIISFDEYVNNEQRGILKEDRLNTHNRVKRQLTITFDDGYANNLYVLAPIIKKNNIPIIIYLPAGLIDNNEIYWSNKVSFCIGRTERKRIEFMAGAKRIVLDLSNPKSRISALITAKKTLFNISETDRKKAIFEIISSCDVDFRDNIDLRPMSWEELKKLKKQLGDLVSFGSHTLTHPLLSKISDAEIIKELSESRKMISKKLVKTDHLSYPFGDYDSRVITTAKRFYSSAVTTSYGYNGQGVDIFRLKRIPVSNNNGMFLFMLSLFLDLGRYSEFFIRVYNRIKLLFHD